MPDSRSLPDQSAMLDDAVHEINQRWGEPFGDDMLPMDQGLVRETAEAILLPHWAEVARLRAALTPFAEHGPYGTWKATDYIDACRVAREALNGGEANG